MVWRCASPPSWKEEGKGGERDRTAAYLFLFLTWHLLLSLSFPHSPLLVKAPLMTLPPSNTFHRLSQPQDYVRRFPRLKKETPQLCTSYTRCTSGAAALWGFVQKLQCTKAGQRRPPLSVYWSSKKTKSASPVKSSHGKRCVPSRRAEQSLEGNPLHTRPPLTPSTND